MESGSHRSTGIAQSNTEKRKAQKSLARSSAQTVSDLGLSLSPQVVEKIYAQVVSDLATSNTLDKFRRKPSEPSSDE